MGASNSMCCADTEVIHKDGKRKQKRNREKLKHSHYSTVSFKERQLKDSMKQDFTTSIKHNTEYEEYNQKNQQSQYRQTYQPPENDDPEDLQQIKEILEEQEDDFKVRPKIDKNDLDRFSLFQSLRNNDLLLTKQNKIVEEIQNVYEKYQYYNFMKILKEQYHYAYHPDKKQQDEEEEQRRQEEFMRQEEERLRLEEEKEQQRLLEQQQLEQEQEEERQRLLKEQQDLEEQNRKDQEEINLDDDDNNNMDKDDIKYTQVTVLSDDQENKNENNQLKQKEQEEEPQPTIEEQYEGVVDEIISLEVDFTSEAQQLQEFYEFKFQNSNGKWDKIKQFFEDMKMQFKEIQDQQQSDEQKENIIVFQNYLITVFQVFLLSTDLNKIYNLKEIELIQISPQQIVFQTYRFSLPNTPRIMKFSNFESQESIAELQILDLMYNEMIQQLNKPCLYTYNKIVLTHSQNQFLIIEQDKPQYSLQEYIDSKKSEEALLESDEAIKIMKDIFLFVGILHQHNICMQNINLNTIQYIQELDQWIITEFLHIYKIENCSDPQFARVQYEEGNYLSENLSEKQVDEEGNSFIIYNPYRQNTQSIGEIMQDLIENSQIKEEIAQNQSQQQLYSIFPVKMDKNILKLNKQSYINSVSIVKILQNDFVNLLKLTQCIKNSEFLGIQTEIGSQNDLSPTNKETDNIISELQSENNEQQTNTTTNVNSNTNNSLLSTEVNQNQEQNNEESNKNILDFNEISIFSICYEKASIYLYNYQENWYVKNWYFSLSQDIIDWNINDQQPIIKHLHISQQKGILFELPNKSEIKISDLTKGVHFLQNISPKIEELTIQISISKPNITSMYEIQIYLELIKRCPNTHLTINSNKIMGDGIKLLDQFVKNMNLIQFESVHFQSEKSLDYILSKSAIFKVNNLYLYFDNEIQLPLIDKIKQFKQIKELYISGSPMIQEKNWWSNWNTVGIFQGFDGILQKVHLNINSKFINKQQQQLKTEEIIKLQNVVQNLRIFEITDERFSQTLIHKQNLSSLKTINLLDHLHFSQVILLNPTLKTKTSLKSIEKIIFANNTIYENVRDYSQICSHEKKQQSLNGFQCSNCGRNFGNLQKTLSYCCFECNTNFCDFCIRSCNGYQEIADKSGIQILDWILKFQNLKEIVFDLRLTENELNLVKNQENIVINENENLNIWYMKTFLEIIKISENINLLETEELQLKFKNIKLTILEDKITNIPKNKVAKTIIQRVLQDFPDIELENYFSFYQQLPQHRKQFYDMIKKINAKIKVLEEQNEEKLKQKKILEQASFYDILMKYEIQSYDLKYLVKQQLPLDQDKLISQFSQMLVKQIVDIPLPQQAQKQQKQKLKKQKQSKFGQLSNVWRDSIFSQQDINGINQQNMQNIIKISKSGNFVVHDLLKLDFLQKYKNLKQLSLKKFDKQAYQFTKILLSILNHQNINITLGVLQIQDCDLDFSLQPDRQFNNLKKLVIKYTNLNFQHQSLNNSQNKIQEFSKIEQSTINNVSQVQNSQIGNQQDLQEKEQLQQQQIEEQQQQFQLIENNQQIEAQAQIPTHFQYNYLNTYLSSSLQTIRLINVLSADVEQHSALKFIGENVLNNICQNSQNLRELVILNSGKKSNFTFNNLSLIAKNLQILEHLEISTNLTQESSYMEFFQALGYENHLKFLLFQNCVQFGERVGASLAQNSQKFQEKLQILGILNYGKFNSNEILKTFLNSNNSPVFPNLHELIVELDISQNSNNLNKLVSLKHILKSQYCDPKISKDEVICPVFSQSNEIQETVEQNEDENNSDNNGTTITNSYDDDFLLSEQIKNKKQQQKEQNIQNNKRLMKKIFGPDESESNIILEYPTSEIEDVVFAYIQSQDGQNVQAFTKQIQLLDRELENIYTQNNQIYVTKILKIAEFYQKEKMYDLALKLYIKCDQIIFAKKNAKVLSHVLKIDKAIGIINIEQNKIEEGIFSLGVSIGMHLDKQLRQAKDYGSQDKQDFKVTDEIINKQLERLDYFKLLDVLQSKFKQLKEYEHLIGLKKIYILIGINYLMEKYEQLKIFDLNCTVLLEINNYIFNNSELYSQRVKAEHCKKYNQVLSTNQNVTQTEFSNAIIKQVINYEEIAFQNSFELLSYQFTPQNAESNPYEIKSLEIINSFNQKQSTDAQNNQILVDISNILQAKQQIINLLKDNNLQECSTQVAQVLQKIQQIRNILNTNNSNTNQEESEDQNDLKQKSTSTTSQNIIEKIYQQFLGQIQQRLYNLNLLIFSNEENILKFEDSFIEFSNQIDKYGFSSIFVSYAYYLKSVKSQEINIQNSYSFICKSLVNSNLGKYNEIYNAIFNQYLSVQTQIKNLEKEEHERVQQKELEELQYKQQQILNQSNTQMKQIQ